MKIVELKFVDDLLSRQTKWVEEASEEEANMVAVGLFDNESFYKVVNYLSDTDTHSHYLKEGWKVDPKDYLVDDMKRLLEELRQKIKELENVG